MLETSQLGKQYSDDVWGIKDVTLELGEGVHGLLGPNGAGKSTLMRILTTVTKPTTGTATWNGVDITESPEAVRSVLGYLPQDFGVYPNLTLDEFLEYVAALRGLDAETTSARIDELVTLTNLEQARDRKLKTYSGGMRQRAGIAQALVNDPDLLVVDEPTVGLDPEERVRFRNIVSSMADDRVVVLSTHIVSDIEATASKVAILDDGGLIRHTRPEAILELAAGNVYEFVVSRDRIDDIQKRCTVSGTAQRTDGIHVRAVADEPPTADATAVEPTLEDAYLKVVGRQAQV